MIPGLNSNIRVSEKMFHIQTEDSGPRYGHVISHLFQEGTILASVKTAYKELLDLDQAELEAEVVKIMRKSHRQMVQKLTSGEYATEMGLNDSGTMKVMVEVEEEELTPAADPESDEAEEVQSSTGETKGSDAEKHEDIRSDVELATPDEKDKTNLSSPADGPSSMIDEPQLTTEELVKRIEELMTPAPRGESAEQRISSLLERFSENRPD